MTDKVLLSESELCELKKHELEIFEHFIAVCDQLGLRYFVIAGTLLGAVRHKGFIPWDDDIDVVMPRKDYDIFMQEAKSLLPEHYFLQNCYTDPEFLHYFSKIRDTKTTYIDADMIGKDICYGVFIDIFPLDYFPPKGWKRTRLRVLNKFYEFRRIISYSQPTVNGNPIREFIKRLLVLLCKVLSPNVSLAIKKCDKLLKSTPKDEYVKYGSKSINMRLIFRTEWFDDVSMMEFEGMKVCVPKRYHEVLEQEYGDYMKLPPVEKRVSHHFVTAIDLDKPYTEYLSLHNSTGIH